MLWDVRLSKSTVLQLKVQLQTFGQVMDKRSISLHRTMANLSVAYDEGLYYVVTSVVNMVCQQSRAKSCLQRDFIMIPNSLKKDWNNFPGISGNDRREWHNYSVSWQRIEIRCENINMYCQLSDVSLSETF